MSLNVDSAEWKLTTDGGIPYKLLEGYPTLHFFADGAEAKEEIIIEKDNLVDFLREAIYMAQVTTTGGVSYRRSRQCPGFSGMYADDIKVEPFPKDKPLDLTGEYDNDASFARFLKLSISYKPMESGDETSGDDPTPWLEVTSDFAVEVMAAKADTSTLYWVTDQAYVDVDTQQQYAVGDWVPLRSLNMGETRVSMMTEWTVSWKHVPRAAEAILRVRMRLAGGTVNSVAMPLLGNAEPGTILFMGASGRKETVWAGEGEQPPYTIDMKFTEKRVVEDGVVKGHNYVWVPEANRYMPVIRREVLTSAEYTPTKGWYTNETLGYGRPLYLYTDLNLLWA